MRKESVRDLWLMTDQSRAFRRGEGVDVCIRLQRRIFNWLVDGVVLCCPVAGACNKEKRLPQDLLILLHTEATPKRPDSATYAQKATTMTSDVKDPCVVVVPLDFSARRIIYDRGIIQYRVPGPYATPPGWEVFQSIILLRADSPEEAESIIYANENAV